MSKPDTTPGRRIAAFRHRKAIRRDVDARLAKSMADGRTTPIFGAGFLVNHAALGLFTRVSLCGRFLGDLSSQRLPTLWGVPCRRCTHIWNAAMARNDLVTEAANEVAISTRAQELDGLLRTGSTDLARRKWLELSDNRALRAGVRTRLSELGTDLTVLESRS